MIEWVTYGLATFLVLVTLLPLSRLQGWYVRVWDFPRAQIFVLCTVTLGLSVVWREPLGSGALWVGVAMLACLAWQGHWILPFSPFYRKEAMDVEMSRENPDRHVRFMTVNVLTPNPHKADLLKQVQRVQPDVLLVLESDQAWQEQLDQGLKGDWPYRMACPLDNLYGMHLYSRLPIGDERVQFLFDDGIPSFHCVLQLQSGEWFRLHCLHPMPPSPTEADSSVERDAELLMVGRSIGRVGGPTVVTGDLNDVAWSRSTRLFRKISRLLDPRIGRGMYSTFHAMIPLLRYPLDHVFHSDHFRCVHMRRVAVKGSDHFAMVAELLFDPAAAPLQEALDVSEEDHDDANELIELADPEDPVHVPHLPGWRVMLFQEWLEAHPEQKPGRVADRNRR